MLKKTMPVKANSFQVLLNPVGNNDSKKYIFYVKVDDVPLGIPMATNPRNQKLTSSVAKAITESLLTAIFISRIVESSCRHPNWNTIRREQK